MRAGQLAFISLLVGSPTIASAQQMVADSMPHAGTWGGEAYVGSGPTGANVLRFMSPKLALVLGAEFEVTHIDRENQSEFPDAFGTTQTNIGGRLGMRSYLKSSTDRLRPVVGVGVRSSNSKAGQFQHWTAGVYGELGATYFLTPHVSMGGSGELLASYGEAKQSGITETFTRVEGSLMRMVLAVYF